MKNINEIHSFKDLKADLDSRGHFFDKIPVDVEAIVKIYGVTIEEDPRFDAIDKLGLVDGKKIWINPIDANEYTALRRHVIAHEFGHIVLHKPVDGELMHFSDSFENIRGNAKDIDEKEEECNVFAAQLLIPIEQFARLLSRLIADGELSRTPDLDVLFRKTAEAFDVPTALVKRLILSLPASNSK